MNWDAISTIAEVVAASGVILSLIYLAKQIKSQIQESRLSAAHEIASGFREMLKPFIDPAFAELFVRANSDFDGLTEAERIQVISVQQTNIRLWEEAFYQYQGGRLDETIWNTMVNQYSSYIAIESFKRVWDLRKASYNREFVEFVESLKQVEYKTK